jgi:hypothetical protein
MARQLIFIDVDENRLELWLKPDRVQLVVVDGRPELEAAELRRFASVLFAEYVARDFAGRLAAVRGRLQDARGRAGGEDPATGELVAVLDDALSAIDDMARSDPALQAMLRASRKRSRRRAGAKATSQVRAQTKAAAPGPRPPARESSRPSSPVSSRIAISEAS